jgi:hypothetical protein
MATLFSPIARRALIASSFSINPLRGIGKEKIAVFLLILFPYGELGKRR